MPLTEISNNASRLAPSSRSRSNQLKSKENVGKRHSKVRVFAQAEPSKVEITEPLTPISDNVAALSPISKANNSHPKPIETVKETSDASIAQASEAKISKKESPCNHRKNQTLPTRGSKIKKGLKHEDSETLMDWSWFLGQPLEGSLEHEDVPFFEQVEKNQTRCHLCEFTIVTGGKSLDVHCRGKHHQVAYQLLEAFHSLKQGNDEILKARLADSLFLRGRISALSRDQRTAMNKALQGHLQNTHCKKWSAVVNTLEFFENQNKICIAPKTSTKKKLRTSRKRVKKNKNKAATTNVLANITTAPPVDKENQKADSNTSNISKTESIPKTGTSPSDNVFCAGKQAAGAIVSVKTITKDASNRVNENTVSLDENSAVSLLCVRISALPKNRQNEMNEALWGHLQNTHYKKWRAVMRKLELLEMQSKICIAPKSSTETKLTISKKDVAKKMLANLTTAPPADKESQKAVSNNSYMSKTESIPKTVMHSSDNVFGARKQATGTIVSDKTITKDASKRVNENAISLDDNSLSDDDLQFSPSSQDDTVFCSSFSSLMAVQQHFHSQDEHDDEDEVDSMIKETLLGITILEIDEFSFEDDDYPEDVKDWANEHNLGLYCDESLNTIAEVNESMFSCAELRPDTADISFTQLIELEEPEDEEPNPAAPEQDILAALAVIEALAFFGL